MRARHAGKTGRRDLGAGSARDQRLAISHQRRRLHQGQGATRIITLNRLFRNSSELLPQQETIEGIEVIRLPYMGSSRYPLCPGVFKYLKDADVIHVHGVDFFYDFLAATKWLHRRPLVLSTHGGFFHTRFASRAKLAYFQSITRLSANAYNQVIATSTNDGDLFGQIMNQRKLQVIENGVDVEKYAGCAAPVLTPLGADFELSNQTRSRQVEWINGRMQTRTLHGVALSPRRSGTLVVPPLQVGQAFRRADIGPAAAMVFAAFVPGHGREIARGGRYDGVGHEFGTPRPATGFSADLNELLRLGAK